jgi:hypothetical protein
LPLKPQVKRNKREHGLTKPLVDGDDRTELDQVVSFAEFHQFALDFNFFPQCMSKVGLLYNFNSVDPVSLKAPGLVTQLLHLTRDLLVS